MVVYAVMCKSSGAGGYAVICVFRVYAKQAAAEALVEVLMSGNRSSHLPTYWVECLEVHTGD
jgi:hypothetical protein